MISIAAGERRHAKVGATQRERTVGGSSQERRLFDRDGEGLWHAAPEARGAFDGIHGGVVGGLLCAVAEEGMDPIYTPAAITVQLPRSAPMTPIRAERRLVYAGRRAAFCDVELWDGEKLVSRGAVTFTAEAETPRAPERPDEPLDPTILTGLPSYKSHHGQSWHDDAMVKAIDPDGVNWYRSDWAVIGGESSLARALPLVDWVSGISRPDDWRAPVVRGTPNVEFTVHATRLPMAGWVGMKTFASWRRQGTGFASASLWDARGEFGRFSTTIILVP